MTSMCSGLVVQVVSALLRGNRQDFIGHDAVLVSVIAELRVVYDLHASLIGILLTGIVAKL